MLQKILEVSQGRRGGVLDHGDRQRQLVEQDVPPLPRPPRGRESSSLHAKRSLLSAAKFDLISRPHLEKVEILIISRSRAAAEHRRSVAQELMMQ